MTPTFPGVLGTQRRVLVVDDNRGSTKGLQLVLTAMATTVRFTSGRRPAGSSGTSFRPHVLVDVGIPVR